MTRIIIDGDTPEDEKLIFTIQDPVKQLIKEMTQCQENEQQP